MRTLAALTLLLAAQSAHEVFEVEPVERPWAQVGEVFDLSLRLPEVRRATGRDIVREMQELVTLQVEVGNAAERHTQTFGDLAVAARAVSPDKRKDWLLEVAKQAAQPELWGTAMRQLLLDDYLFSKKWDPDRDHDRDGILLVPAWKLAGEGELWKNLPGDPAVEQAAVLVWADPLTFKSVENDYAHYGDDVGQPYEKLRPVPGSYLIGEDPAGQRFSTLRVMIRRDLPFPFSNYEIDLRLLNRIDAEGRLVTDAQSKSKDFHWLCGRDVFWTVTDGEGKPVATLVVRLYGFDLDGVPDSSDHRRKALREGLGNLKRKAEARFRERGAAFEGGTAAVPAFKVFGVR